MYGYIYTIVLQDNPEVFSFVVVHKTTCLVTGKIYVGQKKSEVFLNEKYLGSGVILKQAVDKYGKENFKVELLECCNTLEELNEREKY